jgi:large subunit ribosomal protein L29
MKVKEIREKETEHLKHELEDQRKHLFDLRSQAVTEKLEDPSQLKKTRKDIARMMTVLKQRELEATTAETTKAAVAK